MPREIITRWTAPGMGESFTIMYFDSALSVADQRLALGGCLTDWQGALTNDVRYTIETEGRELSDATGTLTGFWSDSTVYTAVGTTIDDRVPDASQVLVRWLTPDIVGGRRIQGRTFVPGCSEGATTDGEMTPTGLTYFQNGGDDLVSAGVGFGVWHRPVSGSGGSFHVADTCTVWNELAVQRGRRS